MNQKEIIDIENQNYQPITDETMNLDASLDFNYIPSKGREGINDIGILKDGTSLDNRSTFRISSFSRSGNGGL